MHAPIYVTQPNLPPMDEFVSYLQKIWDTKILTNNGPFHQELESKLADYLGVKYISLFSNGTLALMAALQALEIKGEVITTPFSFVATTHALWWNNIKPVFVDIERNYFTIDPERIEEAITSSTQAILPVHVYGNPCKVDEIQKVADKHKLKIIYDAAHAFGVELNGKSILNFGDLSILSFHATKTYNTIEGGAIICSDNILKKRIDLLKNFGFENETTVLEPGLNAKMNEIQSAFGLIQLEYIEQYISKRKALTELYRKNLKNITGIRFLNDIIHVKHNYSYFPILIDPNLFWGTRDDLYNNLKKELIFSRRYFYPLISNFPIYNHLESASERNLPVSNAVSDNILCLPIYPNLSISDVNRICSVILSKK